MTSFVVDASVAIKWVVPETGTIEALELLSRAALVAPGLLPVECANILWKKVTRGEMDADEADLAARLLEGATLEIVPTRHLLRRAVELAVRIGHPAYDCLYLAVAAERGEPFVTADERLVRELAQLPSSAHGCEASTVPEALRMIGPDEPPT